MRTADVDAIARTCLYEGYLLWPYRKSALKNAKRWTFGCLFPAAPAAVLGERDALRTEVLVAVDGPPGEVTVRLRFLHVVDRAIMAEGPRGPRRVAELAVAGERHLSWEEATEAEHTCTLAVPGEPVRIPFTVPRGSDTEPLCDASGHRAGSVVRSWEELSGTLDCRSERVADGVYRLTVSVANTAEAPAPDAGRRDARERAAVHAFASAHVVLGAERASFLSLMDPPEKLREAAAACVNDGVWPVLAGTGDARGADTVLASPLTLYDFPTVAPESPGDLFDGLEIDQLLVLGVLSMTEEEQEQARACDPRAREILDRCAGLGLADMAALHGAIREFRPLTPQAPAPATERPPASGPLGETATPPLREDT